MTMSGNRGWLRLAAGVGAALAARALWRQLHAWDLRDRVVVITGGSRGLGLALARVFGRQGAIVTLCSRDGEEVRRAVQDLDRLNIRAVGDDCDITDASEVLAMIGASRTPSAALTSWSTTPASSRSAPWTR
jgi:hypothetical protein